MVSVFVIIPVLIVYVFAFSSDTYKIATLSNKKELGGGRGGGHRSIKLNV